MKEAAIFVAAGLFYVSLSLPFSSVAIAADAKAAPADKAMKGDPGENKAKTGTGTTTVPQKAKQKAWGDPMSTTRPGRSGRHLS